MLCYFLLLCYFSRYAIPPVALFPSVMLFHPLCYFIRYAISSVMLFPSILPFPPVMLVPCVMLFPQLLRHAVGADLGPYRYGEVR